VASKRGVLVVAVCIAGCGVPGEPVPPTPPIPVPVSDLSAHQQGDAVQLSFTLPIASISGDKLTITPSVEILRGAKGVADLKSLRVVDTVPGALLDNYRSGGLFRFTDPLTPEEIRTRSGQSVFYAVRTRVSQKRTSSDSNLVSLKLYPVPERIPLIEIHATETAIELNWVAPSQTSSGEPLSSALRYDIYRAEVAASADSSPTTKASYATLNFKSTPLASSDSNSYRDTTFAFDHNYFYFVRSVIQVDGTAVESADSEIAKVTPRDIFPPAAPGNVVAATAHCAGAEDLYVELSWEMNLETDLAGYRVYRSEDEGTRGELLPSPPLVSSYRDNSVQSGKRYWYRVTAVDRAGNESATSTTVAADVLAETCKQ
jgi:fibronectin type 3 domain-containing protein